MPPTLLTLTPPDSGWMDRAACVGAWTLMESEDDRLIRRAREMCADCPVWRQCRAWVLSLPPREDVYGVAGGLTAEERQKIRRSVRRSRYKPAEPPKTCNKCRVTKPAEEFHLRSARSGREAVCVECRREQIRRSKAARRATDKAAAS